MEQGNYSIWAGTDLAGKPDFGAVLEDPPSVAGRHEGREEVPRVVGVL